MPPFGMDVNKWWIAKLGGNWHALPPSPPDRLADESHVFPTGAEALAAFNEGRCS